MRNFKQHTARTGLAGICAVILTGHAARADFSRYQIILDRQPFGEAPDAEPVAVAPRPAGPSYLDALRLVAMTISQGDIRVGLVDGNTNPARTYFIFVGEQEAGLRILSADYEAESVEVEKDGEQRTLRMGGGGGAAPRRAGPGMIAGGPPEGGGRSNPAIPGDRVGRMSEGRRQRLEEAQRRAEIVPELTGAVLERHLQEYNVQAIREGMPPLPIPLTPEQDAQLVEEGVLPPIE